MRALGSGSGTRGQRRSRPQRAAVLPALTALFLLAVPPTALAQDQQGVAIDLGRIEVDEPLEPGTSYTLPTIRVRNPGTDVTSYRMAVQPIADADAPEPDWFAFTPAGFDLDPDERQPVEVVLRLPAEASGGEYAALLSAQVAPGGDGARVGAAAAARLSFTVTEPPPASEPADRPAGGVPWWLWLFLALAVAAVLLRLARRYDVRIERRR